MSPFHHEWLRRGRGRARRPPGGSAGGLTIGLTHQHGYGVEGQAGEAADDGAVDPDELQIRPEQQLQAPGRLAPRPTAGWSR